MLLQADVVALQEVPTRGRVKGFLGPAYRVTTFSATSEDGAGAVLATRTEHRALEKIDQLPGERTGPAIAALIVKLKSAVGPLVVAHHKPNWRPPRRD